MEIALVFSLVISFLATLLATPFWIKKCKQVGYLWRDVHKPDKKKVASSGGVVVLLSFVLGVLYYIAVRTFLFNSQDGIAVQIFSLLSVILILAVLGLSDDLFGWKHGGLPRRIRLLIAFIAAIPLMVINAGTHNIHFPFLGNLELGLFYPLILIPIGIAGASTAYNNLAGYNGLETGLGVIILTFLSYIAYTVDGNWLALVGLIMVTSLLAFYLYNKFPARVFPGDSLTWGVGALIAIIAIIGNFERIAVFVFLPHIAETLLKIRGKLKKQSFSKPKEDSSLELRYDKIYSLNHVAIWVMNKFKKKVYERDVVYFIFSLQIVIIALAWFMFRYGLF